MKNSGFEPEGILPVVPPLAKKDMQFRFCLMLLPILNATVYILDTQTHLDAFDFLTSPSLPRLSCFPREKRCPFLSQSLVVLKRPHMPTPCEPMPMFLTHFDMLISGDCTVGSSSMTYPLPTCPLIPTAYCLSFT